MLSQGFSIHSLLWLAAIICAAAIGGALSRAGQIRLFAGIADLVLTAMIAALPLSVFALIAMLAPAAPEALRAYLGTPSVIGLQITGIALGLAMATASAMIALRSNGLARGVVVIVVKFTAAPAYFLALPVFLIGQITRNGPVAGLARALRNVLVPNSAL